MLRPERARLRRTFPSPSQPRAIARQLNAERVPGPGGRPWGDTTIRGQPDRGTGILNNPLYAGRLEWNRCSYVKDPRTGKRVARVNPAAAREVVEIPTLRIVDDRLWQAAKARQKAIGFTIARDGDGTALNRAHRAQYLLSGLLHCGVCGGPLAIVSAGRYGCGARRRQGTCNNAMTIARAELEERVLAGLKERLLEPAVLDHALTRYQQLTQQAAAEADRARAQAKKQLAAVQRKIASLLRAVEDGMYQRSMKERLSALEKAKVDLEIVVKSTNCIPATDIAPSSIFAMRYRDAINRLAETLNDPVLRSRAGEVMRSLIDRAVFTPREDGTIEGMLEGELAKLLAFTEEDKIERPGTDVPGRRLSVVAGTRNWLYLLLFAPALRRDR